MLKRGAYVLQTWSERGDYYNGCEEEGCEEEEEVSAPGMRREGGPITLPGFFSGELTAANISAASHSEPLKL